MSATTNPAPSVDWRAPALAGYVLIIVVFGIIGGWAAVAKLDRAVVAPAAIAVETSRKVVQHFEGGIISEILVKEGDQVEENQILFRLSNVQARANFDLQRNQLDAALAQQARLIAERDGTAAITWPEELRQRAAEALVARVMADQNAQFDDRRAARLGQIAILRQRTEQLEEETRGLNVEKLANERQLQFIHHELTGLRELLAQKLVPLNRVMALERERARLEGAIGRNVSDAAKAQQAVSEASLQIQQLDDKFREETAAAMLEVRQKIADLRERATVADDVLQRIEIRAPRAGTVQALKVYGPGQVIRPGEALLEIVPTDAKLVVHVQFPTTDIATVRPGEEVEVRFPSFHSRTIPVILGRLDRLSEDRLVEETTHQPYYLGIVSVDRLAIPAELQGRLRAGMPAEVLAAAGERTVLSYITSPLFNSLRKAFTEQ